MNKKIVPISFGLIALLVLVSFSTIISAQTIKSNVQHLKDKITTTTWEPGFFLFVVFMIIASIKETLKYGIPG